MSSLNVEQVSQLKEIGSTLKKRRQELSISIEEVAAKTHIRLPILKALEAGQSDELPEAIFIQGFIRHYGDALELDGATLAKSFPTESSNFLPVEINKLVQNVSKDKNSFTPRYIIYGVLALAVISGVFYLINKPRVSESMARSRTPLNQQEETVARRVPVSSPTPTPTPSPTSTQVTPIKVTLKLQEQSWLQVVVDGKTEFEGNLAKGKQQTWTAKKQLTLRAGNAGAVSTSFNGEKPKLLGSLGDVKEVTFTAAQD